MTPTTLAPSLELDDSGPAEAELRKVIEQLERLGAQLVAVGHGRDPRSRCSAERFAAAWPASHTSGTPDRCPAAIVHWPQDAASWLKAARRLCPASRRCNVLARWNWVVGVFEVGVDRPGEGDRFVRADRVVGVEEPIDVGLEV